ncbi:MAG TPA: sialidase family protein, partial [Anseongella sp.]|nr:sialidase family protein [Anseongella sp.]
VWLMKDGLPDYGKILFKGYTDYYPAGDTLSWVKYPDGMHMIPHRNYYPITDEDHFGGNPNSYQHNWVYSKYFVPVGAGKSFYMYTRLTIGTFSGTAMGLVLGRSWETREDFVFGMDGFSNIAPTFFLNLYGTTIGVDLDKGWPTVNEVIVPGIPADVEVVIHDGQFYCRINGTLAFAFKLPPGQTYYYMPRVRPHRNFIYVHDMYIESNDMYTVNYAMHEQEQGYARIQAPALARTGDDDLLLFAEGRSNPRTAEERVAQHTRPAGDCDIIMRRSSDGGSTWEEQIAVIAGEGSPETYCFPQVVSTAGGKIILHYSALSGSVVNGNYEYDPGSQRIYQVESTDGGGSWSAPVEITSGLPEAAGYIRNGPGHGIELASAAYSKRLLMPLTIGENTVKVAISDDEGASWRLSEAVSGSGRQYGSIAELEDGRLMMVMGHNKTSPRSKLVSYSSDGGETWGPATQAGGAGIETGSFGHLYQGVIVKGAGNTIHLISPTNREKDSQVYNGPTYAASPALFSSTDGGASFQNKGALFTKEAFQSYLDPIGFMDAVALDDGTVVIAGEGGVERPQEGIVIYRK